MTQAVTIRRYQEPPRHAGADYYEPPEPAPARLGPAAGGLALIALLVTVRGLWAAQLLLVLLLLVVPGVVLLRALRVPGRAVASFPVYVPVASLVVLLFSGLAVDWAGLLAGDAAPLRAWPLLAGLELICFTLLASSARAPTTVDIPWHRLSGRASLALPLILPLVAAVGALRLNQGNGNAVALTAVSAGVVMVSTATVMSSQLDVATLAVVIYAAGLATTWSFSLRSDLVNGFDIGYEYYLMHHTVLSGVWYTNHPGDAYGAMLSITVLAAQFHAVSGVPELMVLRLIYPTIYALFAVAIFFLARRVISRRWAFVAAAFTMAQFFFPEMAGFARQQIALVFFATLVAAMLDTRTPGRARRVLVAFLGLAVAVSHYSTDYMAITVIGLTLPLQWLAARIRDVPRATGTVVVAFTSVLLGGLLWYGPVTHSSSHVIQFVQTTLTQGLDVLPNRSPGENLFAAYLKGNTRTTIQAARYAHLIQASYAADKPYVRPLADASWPKYALHDSPVPLRPVKWRLGYGVLSICLLIIAQLANLLAGVGALWMVLQRKATVMSRQIGIFGLAVVLVLIVIRISGTVAEAYGQERALLQALVLLAITMSWAMQRLSGRSITRQTRVFAATVVSLALIAASTTNLTGEVLGGGTSDNLANSGAAFEYFYITGPELASARWLGKNVAPGQLVYADEYGQVPLVAVTGIQHGLLVDLTPLTIDQHAWVYASRTNVVDGRAFALYKRQLASYVFPARYLNDNYNLVYSNGSSEVFHR